ncbi:glutamine--fructose-6-phosphate aminotransferase [Candidatus Falkowbacteria bacterium RIFOXYB2_FULL_47_14]|uniref:Glutamine--fructose-6-phosphate aminotransferase [isomerizing] n=1 Tax=Candidatus Falkowbacteria bacterium RIFOXYA2_FULL_47_19 TaxID=1797994 RepID=A0A1F5SLY6_9BACT|nr:MAG: glutamine--fructose-6-phosphate aminotransferase [Candidatus Falkowbacteria bacterium RIFOXYA2_FULL_47_19]OGF34717.1 MAG: glutamine--fructose-6-phosphate aminotransferase [Candidatus Falkowbacteria bacterium RIFOXYC2_FULL_46_15]OGF42875.1 MAG: glutamine--fructose-6-phosphate aminotransferase [Candidatus Falkowbacteria bacterium RIFOXYB2_FULL_47_14]
MCGIVGYVGRKEAAPILLDGIRKLEYRGYDSSGLSVWDGDFSDFKAVGKICELDKKIAGRPIAGRVGIAHTRWATHGRPTEENAHPHLDCSGKIRVVHNGIIENYQALKTSLRDRGHEFISETDTEVIPHLIEEVYDGDIISAVMAVVGMLEGAYGLAIIHADEPDKIVVVKRGSPLILGIGPEEMIVASDAAAVIRYTRDVIYLEDGEIAEIKDSGYRIFDGQARAIEKNIHSIEWDIERAEKSGYPHFMLKEIFEQPRAIEDSIRGRIIAEEGLVKFGGFDAIIDKLREIDRLVIVACGTAYHAGLAGEYMLEEHAGVPAEVEWASEFRYRSPALGPSTAVLAVSQSGETADTLAAVREARARGAFTLGIVNVVGSTIAREVDAGIYNHIGPEISVASTKAFTSQATILALLTVLLGRQRRMTQGAAREILEEIKLLPFKIETILKQSDYIAAIAAKYRDAEHFAYLGRKYNQPTAREGALKLKEISYIHAEGFASGEMKHGPLAMIDEDFPSVFIAPRDSVYEKNLSNMEEIKSRDGRIIAITTEGSNEIEVIADDVIYIPPTLEMLTPILAAVPLQLLAYYIAALNDRDVDKPRNLAKSVTVE